MGFIPTIMEHPGREARLNLKEPEDNKLLPYLKTINVVVKKLYQTDFPSHKEDAHRSKKVESIKLHQEKFGQYQKI
jgi:hypothetical protein